MALRFNPPPNWPAPPANWSPPSDWQPDPSWGPPPPGWQLWVPEQQYATIGAQYQAEGASPVTAGGMPEQSSSPAWYGPPAPPKRKKWPWVVGVVVLLLVLSQCGGSDDPADSSAEAGTVATAAPNQEAEPTEAAAEAQPAVAEQTEAAPVEAAPVEAAPTPPPLEGYGSFPADEAEFVSLVTTAQQGAQAAENDMQVAAAKATRDAGLCALLPARSVAGWTGKLVEVGANGDGKGILTVEVAPDVELGTWNNFLSDAGDDTLIEPTSPLFVAASTLVEGQTIRFSGEFLPGSSTDCLKESSLTLSGGVESPNFIFRFSEVSPN